ncbi:DNA topoisomerase 4 subunit A [compost metagenome]
MLGQKEDSIEDISLQNYTEECLRVYGSYVVEDRAVPDFRDGCKPVHRALLWSLAGLGLTPDKGYKKSARTVGDTIGKFHPHGDGAAYGAMVTIANTMPPAVDGQGNWGTPINPAAAQRYTEARMSKFAHAFLLDSKYLSVVPKVPNFSGDDVIPLYLPALLPYVLFNGNVPAPAYGVRAGNPSFSLPSVAKIVINMLKGKDVNAKTLAKNLEILHPYGCESVTSDEEYLSMMATGKGSITYAPLMSADFKTRKINIRSFVPAGLASKGTIDKTLVKLSNLNGVKKVFSQQGKKTKGSGPYGAIFVVEVARNIGEDAFADLVELVEKHVTNSVGYRLGVTIRKADEANKFKYLSYVTFFQQWIKYRIALELKLIKSLIVKAERDLHVNEVYLFAVENMDKILKALPKVLTSADPDKTLAKILDIPLEDAVIILDRKVRQLAKMEAGALKEKIKDLKAEIKTLNADLKAPGERAARDTAERVKKYLKKPDANKSGLTFE